MMYYKIKSTQDILLHEESYAEYRVTLGKRRENNEVRDMHVICI